MSEDEDEEQAKVAFKRIRHAVSNTLDGEDSTVAFCTILSVLAEIGYANDFTIPQMKDQLQNFLKTYAVFLERRKGIRK